MMLYKRLTIPRQGCSRNTETAFTSWKVCYIELTTISYTDCSITSEGVRV